MKLHACEICGSLGGHFCWECGYQMTAHTCRRNHGTCATCRITNYQPYEFATT